MSISGILSKLKDVSDASLVDIFIPSLGKPVKFKQLTVKQQKDLMKTALDGILSPLTFINTINNIILENKMEEGELLTTDRFPIILELRRSSFGSEVIIDDKIETKTYNLDEILKRELVFDYKSVINLELDGTELVVSLEVPSIKNDVSINGIHLTELRKDKNIEVSDTIGSLFVYEIVKFVKGIRIGSETIDLTKETVPDRIKVIENLPTALNNSILDYIKSFRTKESEYSSEIPLDARLFSK